MTHKSITKIKMFANAMFVARFNKKRFLKHHTVSHTEIDPAECNFVPETDDEGFHKYNVCELKINNSSNYKRHY